LPDALRTGVARRAKPLSTALATTLALSLAAVFALPTTGAVAKAAPTGSGQIVESMQLRGSNGYRFTVLDVSGRGITVTAERAISRRGGMVAEYALPRSRPPSPDLDFRLGDEGRFDVHFVATRTKEGRPPPKGCTGEPGAVERGFFVGSIHFRGKRGFTQVDARRAPGIITRSGTQHCPEGGGKDGASRGSEVDTLGLGEPGGKVSRQQEEAEAATLRLIAGDPSGTPRFEAIDFKGPAGFPESSSLSFLASDSSKEGDLTVTRAAVVLVASPASFSIPDPERPRDAATVEPPAPFSGSASFALVAPTKGEFSGDLAVELPGLGRLPLTGAGIDAGICQGRACTKTLPPALRPPRTSVSGVAVSESSR
jgi:hypothetical protein